MNKSYLAFLMCVVSFSCFSAPIVFETEDSIMLIDPESIKTIVFDSKNHLRTSTTITMTLKDNLKDEGKVVRGFKRHTVINCKNQSMQILRIMSLDENANIINTYKNTTDDWNKAAKDTLADKEIKAVCHYNTYEA